MMIQFPLLCWKLRGNFNDFDATTSSWHWHHQLSCTQSEWGHLRHFVYTRLPPPGTVPGISESICVETNTPHSPPLASNVLAQLPVFVLTTVNTIQCLTAIKTRIKFDEWVSSRPSRVDLIIRRVNIVSSCQLIAAVYGQDDNGRVSGVATLRPVTLGAMDNLITS